MQDTRVIYCAVPLQTPREVHAEDAVHIGSNSDHIGNKLNTVSKPALVVWL